MLAEIGASANVTKMMFLAICYSANVGGTGTLIGGSSFIIPCFHAIINRNWHLCSGTPPNLIMYDFLGDFPNQPVSSLSEWNIASTNNMNYDDIIKGEFPLLDGL